MDIHDFINNIEKERIVVGNSLKDLEVGVTNNAGRLDVYKICLRTLRELDKTISLVKAFKYIFFEGFGEYEKQLAVLRALEND